MFSLSAKILSQRPTSAFPLSIGTSLAFESLFDGPQPTYDPARIKPPPIDAYTYQSLWLNIDTIYRNIYEAVETEQRGHLLPGDLLDTLIEEIGHIRDIVNQFTQGQLSVVFFHSRYEGMKAAHPWAELRIPKTPLQLAERDLMQASLEPLIKNHTKDLGLEVFKRGLEVSSAQGRTLIFTHMAYDLLSHRKFSELHLLESHTGMLKKHASFFTKLSKVKDHPLTRIPFNLCSMQVFGDSRTFFGMKKEVKMDLIQLAERANWNSQTTYDRMRMGIQSLKDKLTADILIKMLHESV